jgi:hypothetical protein
MGKGEQENMEGYETEEEAGDGTEGDLVGYK